MPFVILPTNSASGGYEITNSLRFNSGSSDYLNRTPSSSGNRQIWTFSFWIKKTALASRQNFFQGGNHDAGSNSSYMEFSSGNVLRIAEYNGSIETYNLDTTQLFRDVSAFYHIVVAFDTTQATSTNRVKLYVNGTQVTSFSTSNYPTQNYNTSVNHTLVHNIGRDPAGGFAFNGYMSDVYLIDGQQLTPSSFGETDFDTGIWKPKAYTGTYGTNGFYLQFKNSASLGTDSSGNGNTFTVNNLTSVDQSTDTPTNNFATGNPLIVTANQGTFAEGNLQLTGAGLFSNLFSTIAVDKGKWYMECKVISNPDSLLGIASIDQVNSTFTYIGSTTLSWGYHAGNGKLYNNGSNTTYGNTYTTGDIVGIALDMDNGKVYFHKNGTYQNSSNPTTQTNPAATGLTGYYYMGTSCYFSPAEVRQLNYGSPPYSANSYTDGAGYGNFSYAVPSGYYALNTKNLATFG
jgi:hypothetical protein